MKIRGNTITVQQISLSLNGGTMRGVLDMANHIIKGIPAPTADDHAASKKYADNLVAESAARTLAESKDYADTKKHPFTLQFSAWTDAAPYTQNITVKGLTDEVFARVYPVYPTALEEKLALTEETSKVRNCTRHGDVMTFECWEDKPVKDIPIVVEVYV